MRNFRFILIGYIFMCLKYGAVVYAQTCTVGGDQVTYGNGSWIGYVYDHNGVGNPVTNPFLSSNYKGYVTESAIFDRNWSNDSSPDCANATSKFSVRYKMNIALSGTYTFTIGGDDGVRLSIDGGTTWLISLWSDHAYNTSSSGTVVLNGNYNLVFEFYEKSGYARASFTYAQLSTDFLMPAISSKIATCSGTFYDSGGSTSNYGDNENRTLTVYPATCGAKLQVVFNSFNTENDYDGLRIYNGNSTSSPLISSGLGAGSNSTTCPAGSWRGSGSPGTIISTASDGSLTFVFKSDGSINSPGWKATFSCVGSGTISGPAALCAGDTATFYSSYNSSNYSWVSGSTNLATINSSTGLLTSLTGGNTAINYTNYYNSTTSCTLGTSLTVINPLSSAVSSLTAGDFIWTGKSNTDWMSISNWKNWNGSAFVIATGIPVNTTNVIIPPTGSCVLNQPNLAANTGNTRSLLIESGATLTDGTGTINVYGDWTNNGTFVYGTGLVNFSGSVNQSIGGTGTNNFYNLKISNTSSGVTLTNAAAAINNLTMADGNIATTTSNLLTIGSGVSSPGTINWSSGTTVKGPLRRWFQATTNSGNSSGLFPVGTGSNNRWALLEYTTAPTTAGWITAEFKAINPTSTTAGTNGLTLIDQWNWQLDAIIPAGYWEITPTPLSGGTYNIKLRANSMTAPDYTITRIIKSPSAHTTWTLNGTHGTISGNGSDYQISRTGLSGYSYFAIAYPTNSPLPVELTAFNGDCTDGGAILNWTTATEHNSAYYLVDRSRDGAVWTQAGTVNAAGNSTSELNYQLVDPVPFEGVMYYRLTQVDLDGVSKVYPVIAVSCGDETEDVLKVYPNPSGSTFYVDFQSSKQLDAYVTITNMEGVIVYETTINLTKGQNISEINAGELAAGMYFVVLYTSEGKNFVIKHVVK